MGLKAELRRSFVAGLLLVAPLAVTLFVGRLALGYISNLLRPLVRLAGLAKYTANIDLLAQALAAFLLAGAIVLLGFIAQRSVGQQLFGGFDRLFEFVPLVSTVYSSVRQVGEALSNRATRYEEVVLVEYPRVGVYSLGFVTGDSPPEAESVTGDRTYNVFVPNSPNPTAGNLILVPESRVHATDLSVRRGLRLIVTTGIADTEAGMNELREESGVA
ncbi:DUF502 domain-containing protein [Halorarius litoreus]|uniref:DUF502 domain-containing protein n=1 Tax=Halorarius litoreus TaxID=2962676 RepID=UPI0020CE52E4|nr:DUF502 domain-containing protein [Halorarius litoreus]